MDEFVSYSREVELLNCNGITVLHSWHPQHFFQSGHSSLSLSNGQHISFLPEKFPVIPFIRYNTRECSTLLSEIKIIGRIPDENLNIRNGDLDEMKIMEWWNEYKNNTFYSSYLNNSAIITLRALKVGGFEFSFGIWSSIIRTNIKAFDLIRRSGRIQSINFSIRHSVRCESYLNSIDKLNSEGFAVIHLWRPYKTRDVGHLSMTLSNKTHIGYWPENNVTLKNHSENPKKFLTLKEELDMEGRLPDNKLEIPKMRINEAKIVRWWALFPKIQPYHLFKNNCAITVHKALCAGDFGKVFKGLSDILEPDCLNKSEAEKYEISREFETLIEIFIIFNDLSVSVDEDENLERVIKESLRKHAINVNDKNLQVFFSKLSQKLLIALKNGFNLLNVHCPDKLDSQILADLWQDFLVLWNNSDDDGKNIIVKKARYFLEMIFLFKSLNHKSKITPVSVFNDIEECISMGNTDQFCTKFEDKLEKKAGKLEAKTEYQFFMY